MVSLAGILMGSVGVGMIVNRWAYKGGTPGSAYASADRQRLALLMSRTHFDH